MYHYMKISAFSFLSFFLLCGSLVDAAKVEVIQVPSAKMEKKIPATLILPDAYFERESEKFPVLYLCTGRREPCILEPVHPVCTVGGQV